MVTRFGAWATFLFALGAMALPAAAQQVVKDLPGPIDSLQDLQDTGRMVFKVVDANNDNQISQKEAIDAANLAIGGFFFRADANGDGALTQDEMRSAREAFLKDRPWAKYVIEAVRNDKQKQGNQGNASQGDPTMTLVSVFDTNGDKKLEASEVRQGIQTMVQGVFATADTNRDGQLSPTEVNSAIAGIAKTLAQAAFKKADKDGNGSLSEQEFRDAMKGPLHTAFVVADLNHDGQISQEEAQRIRQVVAAEIRKAQFPEPENSARNLIRSGRRPSEVAPVPTFTAPGGNAGEKPKNPQ